MGPKRFKILAVEEENSFTKTITVECGDEARPGQFYMVWLPGTGQKPFSVSASKPLQFSIAGVGPASNAIISKKPGEYLWLSGPYGKAFKLHGKKAVMIGGGYGTGPMRYLCSLALENGIEPHLVIGARTKDRLMKHPASVRTFLCTDDGSEGRKGFVTDVLAEIIKNEKIDAVYACGPERMMEAVGKMAKKEGIFCQLLLERYMKCGFGMCGQCSCGESLICVDGPVYGIEILDNPEFGKFHRDSSGKKVNL
ncbi:MAG: dihydroorotate dehydrogenase electron transfer subunit [Candidatus Micrarchaeia archaeon]